MSVLYNTSAISDGLLLCVDAANNKPNIINNYTISNVNNVSIANGYHTFNGSNYLVVLGSDQTTTPLNAEYNGRTIEMSFWMDPAGFTYSGSPFYRAMIGNSAAFVENRTFNSYIYTYGVNTFNLHTSFANGTISHGPQIPLSISTSTWYILTISIDQNGNQSTYLNGSLISTIAGGAGNSKAFNVQSGAPVTLGSADNFWYGRIGFWRIYNRNLSAAEVLQNFNAFRGRYGI